MSDLSNNIQVVLFDLGGVLVDLGGPPFKHEWSPLTNSDKDVWQASANSKALHLYETGKIRCEDFAQQFVEEQQLNVTPEFYLEFFTHWPKGLFPGALDVVRRIPEKYIRAIYSNTSAAHWPRLMKEMQLDKDFDHYFASFQIGHMKPGEEGFVQVAEKLNIAPEKIFFMDDNIANIETALSLGFNAVHTKGIDEVEAALVNAGIIAP